MFVWNEFVCKKTPGMSFFCAHAAIQASTTLVHLFQLMSLFQSQISLVSITVYWDVIVCNMTLSLSLMSVHWLISGDQGMDQKCLVTRLQTMIITSQEQWYLTSAPLLRISPWVAAPATQIFYKYFLVACKEILSAQATATVFFSINVQINFKQWTTYCAWCEDWSGNWTSCWVDSSHTCFVPEEYFIKTILFGQDNEYCYLDQALISCVSL